ncbi:MAG TPA: phosphoribosylformylglycinamidine synthase subunit PurQ [Candidatus Marinimicrobia bacterium]|nr:phosphoribosylformylglycinamidine synthase subunit PurQ [Candidatus Neomarinimicrobiota bacterium]
MKAGIIVFPGSNCDHDAYWALRETLDIRADFIWHRETELKGYDFLILPGGFSYGDYLRSGAIARFSPVMQELQKLAEKGTPIIGICNGFQILTESGLLPGALTVNDTMKFECRMINLKLSENRSLWTKRYERGAILNMPIAHGEGRYIADSDLLKELEDNQQIVFQYCDEAGNITDAANPNGSVNHIAGICNKEGNVLGMMPHPERVVEAVLGGTDGKAIFQSLLEVL